MDFVRPFNFEQLGYTSDHVRRDIEVKTSDAILKGCTWNLQERCYSKEDGPWGYANNPLSCSEDKSQYETRKFKQINEIVSICEEKDFDFLLFQEVDFFFPEYYEAKGPEENIPFWLLSSLEIVKGYFLALFIKHGFNFIWHESKEIVICYKMDRLYHVGIETCLTYKSKWETKDVLLMGTFKDNKGNIIKLGSMHGQYGEDYSESVPKLLNKLKSDSHCVVIGGDMNHPPNLMMSNLLVLDENETTNFFSNYAETTPYTKVELNDPRSNTHHQAFSLPKAYDGFFVTSNSEVSITISGSHTWTKAITATGDEYPVLIPTSLKRILTL